MFDEFTDSWSDNDATAGFISPPTPTTSDLLSLAGDNNSYGTVSSVVPQSQQPASVKTGAGSMPDLVSLARDVGTAVGTAKTELSQIKTAYNGAQNAAASQNSLAQWWQYASTTDKLIVGLGALTIIVMLVQEK